MAFCLVLERSSLDGLIADGEDLFQCLPVFGCLLLLLGLLLLLCLLFLLRLLLFLFLLKRVRQVCLVILAAGADMIVNSIRAMA